MNGRGLIIAVITVGVGLGGLILNGQRTTNRAIGELRQDVSELRERMDMQDAGLRERMDMQDAGLRERMDELQERMAGLQERMARLEGLFEGYVNRDSDQ